MRAPRSLVIFVCAAILAALVPAAAAFEAAPAPSTVCPEGPPVCSSSSIQAAVAAASPGTTVLVRAGRYVEQVTVPTSRLTICSTSDGISCGEADVSLAAPEGTGGPVVRLSGAHAVLSGTRLEGDVVVGAKGVVLRDNVLTGRLRVASGLKHTAVDARLNGWGTDDWRSLAGRVSVPGTGNSVVQMPFRTAAGRIEPPLPRVVGRASHSGTASYCENWDADGDGFGDGIYDTGAAKCRFLNIQSAIDFSHANGTVVVPASQQGTPRFEVLHIDVNNHGGALVGGGTISGSPEALTGLTLCAGPNAGGTAEPPLPEQDIACATADEATAARAGAIVDGGNDQGDACSGGICPPSGVTVVDVGADDVTVETLTLRWSSLPGDPSPPSDMIGVELSGSSATVRGNMIHVQPEGCGTPSGCFGRVIYGVLSNSAPDATLEDNVIRGDVGSDGSVGGVDGIRDKLPDGTVTGNHLTGWASSGANVHGSGLVFDGNLLTVNGNGLQLCTGASGADMTATNNVFVGHVDAISLTGCGTSVNAGIHDNALGLSNQTALLVKDNVGAGTVSADCNDWGVYHADAIPARIGDLRAAPGPVPVDFQPFRSPTAQGGPLECLIAPFARFATDLDPGVTSENQVSPLETTRFHDVQFTDISTTGDKPIVEWLWTFDSEGMSTDQNPTFRFDGLGLKTVDLLVTDADGLTSAASMQILITTCSTDSGDDVVKNVPDGTFHCSIQAAIDDPGASSGDTILVPPDTYFENVTIDEAELTVCRSTDGATCAGALATDTVIDPESGTPVRFSAANATLEGFAISGASPLVTGTAISGPTVRLNTLEQVTGSTASQGIQLADTSGALVEGNVVTGHVVAGSVAINLNGTNTAPVVRGNTVDGAGTAIRLGDSTGGLVEGNTITIPPRTAPGAGDSLGISLFVGTGNVTRSNELTGAGISILVGGSTDARSEGDILAGADKGIVLRVSSSTQPTGLVVRDGVLRDAFSPLVFESGVSGVIADARLNDWGLYDHRELPSRVTNNGAAANRALQLPFLLANGTAEPPLPSSTSTVSNAACAAQDSDGDGVADAEVASGVCRFLTVQAAVNLTGAAGEVTVPMSQNTSSPTPWFEKLTVGGGKTVCATVAIGLCEPTNDVARFAASASMWATPPVAHQGQAVRMAGISSTSLFTRTFDAAVNPVDPVQVDDLTGLSVDFLRETGTCAASDPRITLRVDTNSDGTADTNYHVYPPATFTCPLGRWTTIDYLQSNRWGNVPGTTPAGAHTFLSGLSTDYDIITMNLIHDGAPGTVVWTDNQRYQNAFFRESTDGCDGDARNPTCSSEQAQPATILDATSVSSTGVVLGGSNVTLDGFTVRRTAPPSTTSGNVAGIDLGGATAPTVERNAVRMEGGGCSAQGIQQGRCHAGLQANGIIGSASNATITDNLLSGRPASSDGTVGATTGMSATLTGTSLVDGNSITAFAANGIGLNGSGAIVSGNTFEGNGDGIQVCATNARLSANTFTGHFGAVVACQTGTGLVMRNNVMPTSNSFGVRIPSPITNLTIDARMNDWGVYQAQLVAARVLDQNAPLGNNRVQQSPFNGPS